MTIKELKFMVGRITDEKKDLEIINKQQPVDIQPIVEYKNKEIDLNLVGDL